MSNSTSGALKTLCESLGTGLSFYRDRPPRETALPYGSISEAISVVPEPAFNSYDDPEGHVSEQAQIDVWQQWRDVSDNTIDESYTIPDAIYKGLRGAALATAPTHVAGLRVLNRVRLFEFENNVIHDVFTVEVHRTLTRV